MSKKFSPNFWLQNKHIQTSYAALFRKNIPIHFDIETFSLSDGDFLECFWYNTNKHNASTVILFHGLAGSYKSPYMQGIVKELNVHGFNSVIMHFRGCSGKLNLLPRSYHSGDTADAIEYISAIKTRYPNSKLFAVGYSLGANMLLKLLGEFPNDSFFDAAIAVSAPMQLDLCANQMNKGFSRFYQARLLKDLISSLDEKYEHHDIQKLLHLKREEIKNLKSFWEYDEAYTAPIHGFTSAQDYYDKSSSKQYLKQITTPTLIIHSKDDPFMNKDVLPNEDECSPSITLEVYEHGGHVGFIEGSFLKPVYWLEKRIVEFLLSF